MQKVGRNDPCPCGSGKKFKQCCMRQEAAQGAGQGTAQENAPASAIRAEVERDSRQALEHLAAGRLAEAEALYRRVLERQPEHADALHYLGVIVRGHGDSATAAGLIGRAVALNPGDAYAQCNLGNALLDLRRLEEALACYDRALALKGDFVEAWYNRGNALLDLGRNAEALDCFERTLQLRPDFAAARVNRSMALYRLGRVAESLDECDAALRHDPADAVAWNNRGLALHALGRDDEALSAYAEALRLRPSYPEACNNLGSTLQSLRRLDEAIACYVRALQLQPGYVDALGNLGGALQEQKRVDEAIACLRNALALNPDHVNAHYNLGAALQLRQAFDEAAGSYRHVLRLDPAHRRALGYLASCVLNVCDWDAAEALGRELLAGMAAGTAVVPPFNLLGFPASAHDQLVCAQRYLADALPQRPQPLWTGQRYTHERIRVAYLSADFHQHATAYLMAELFELHDRGRFEIVGMSFGPDDGSPMRARLQAAFDRFVDVRGMTDEQAARLLREMEIDIAVDLKGYTQDARFGILAHRPAPVQVNYLGYPGTMGADFIDYIVADAVIAPSDQQAHFSERIVHLPDCYQVNDRHRAIAPDTPTRSQCGLPETGFVFCSFNNNYKITRAVFAVWMRLLQAVPGSVLWLLQDNGAAQGNLQRQAQAHGVDAARLVFAPRMPLDVHLARHRLADLFLDTLPINAHTTASDALWAGLPVLTCLGQTMVGRVAGSLLHALGLDELVTSDLAQYEAAALRLARNPEELAGLRARLAQGREQGALFDTQRFARHLESAYRTMWERSQAGQAPAPFAVERLGGAH